MPVKTFLNLVSGRGARHAVPDGQRVYAVGDIHGRLDLVERMLELIAAEEASRPAAETTIIFLGDLIDRGPDSRGVVDRLLALSRSGERVRFLIGNHEEVFLRAIAGDPAATRFLARIGGRETLLSYGVGEAEYRGLDFDELTERLERLVPPEHVAFLSGFERWIEIGDYLFVHAGIRPGLALDEQSDADLCWIRDDFLNHRGSFGKIVVHGHSITPKVDLRPNRIGIDTGAYASGRLTAVLLEARERSFIST